MLNHKNLIPALVLVLFPLGASAGPVEALIAQIEEKGRDIEDVKFDFAQTAEIPATGEVQNIEGAAFFKKPDKFRFEYKKPRKQVIVSDGKYIWVYSPDYNQVIKDEIKEWTSSSGFPDEIINFHSQIPDLSKKYIIEMPAEAGGDIVLELTPRNVSSFAYKTTIWLDKTDFLPRKTEFKSKSFSTTTSIFKLKANTGLGDRLFKFKIPRNADVYKGSEILN